MSESRCTYLQEKGRWSCEFLQADCIQGHANAPFWLFHGGLIPEMEPEMYAEPPSIRESGVHAPEGDKHAVPTPQQRNWMKVCPDSTTQLYDTVRSQRALDTIDVLHTFPRG